MALFSRKNTQEADAPQSVAASKVSLPTDRDLSSVLVKPRITEKAVGQSERNVYTFVVRRDATKHQVKDAVRALYNVTPVKVNIVNKAPKREFSRAKGRMVSSKGMKKAYVYLKKGDTIALV
jgi:large subunit ribosomal protein L23